MENNTPTIYSNENQSATIGKIAAAMCKAQSDMGSALKSSDNPFFKSKYADVSECLKAALPALNDNGIALIQGSDWDSANKAFFVTTTLLHTSGEWIASKLYVPITKHDAQGVGAAMTYGRRFLLSGMCALAQADDDGNSISLQKLEKGKAGVPRMAQLGASPNTKQTTTIRPQPTSNSVVPAKVSTT